MRRSSAGASGACERPGERSRPESLLTPLAHQWGGAGVAGDAQLSPCPFLGLEPVVDDMADGSRAPGLKELLEDPGDTPFESLAHEEVRARVEEELRQIAEPFRTTVVLRDIEDLSYEEIVEVTKASLGTVKSRLTRGREMLKKRLQSYVNEIGEELGLAAGPGDNRQPSRAKAMPEIRRAKVEVTS